MIQHFIIEGHYMGQAQRQLINIHGQLQPPPSLIFICSVCGEAYARCPVESSHKPLWQPMMRCCSKCTPDTFTAPAGSIWLSWDDEFTLAFPEPVLHREFLLHLNHFGGQPCLQS